MEQIRESLSVLVIPFDPLGILLWCVFLAAVLLYFATLRQKYALGKWVETLLEKGCDGEENALSAREIGLSERRLSHRVRLIEKVKGEDGATRYFLPPENREKAEALLKNSSTPWYVALPELLGFYLFLRLLAYLLPILLSAFGKL